MAKPIRVLLVDDDLYIRDLYQELLTNEGYTVEIAAEGRTGFEKISEGGFDLIILDVMLPLLDGFGILTNLEDNPPKKANGKVILLTNLANDPIVKEAANLPGVFTCLIKADITPDKFVATVKEALK